MHEVDFEGVFGALPSAHMLLDRELRYVAANAAYAAVTMRSIEELRGRNIFAVFPNEGESGRRLKQSFERVFASGTTDTLAYIPYDIPRPDALGGGMEVRYWTATHVPIFDEAGQVAYVLQSTADVTELAQMRQAASLPYRLSQSEPQLLERAREAETMNRALLAESADFRRLFQQAPGLFAVLSGPHHVFTFTSDSYTRFIGGRQVLGLNVRQAFPEVVEQGFVDLLDTVYREGRTHSQSGARVMLSMAEGEPLREVFVDFSFSPIRAPGGEITGVFVQGTDQTETFLALRREQLLVDELNHRVKNALATVQSIASQTFRSNSDLGAAREAFEARLHALAGAHRLLSDRHWVDAELRALVEQELSPYGSERWRVSGPRVTVGAKAAVGFSLVLHELTTNAAKYGALSRGEGCVELEWWVSDDRLHLRWSEKRGPAVRDPERTGFGSRLVQRVVVGELGGKLQRHFDENGFSAVLEVPLAMIRHGKRPMLSSLYSPLAGTSVFVLEDESLLLFELEEMLGELGCTVIGPAMRLEEADAMLDAAAAADIAVLDVNIGGRLVFPLAQKLRERNLPILFATGYDREGLPPDWRDEPILPKPYSREQVAAALLAVAQGD